MTLTALIKEKQPEALLKTRIYSLPSGQADGDSKWMDLEKAVLKGRGVGGATVWCEERLTVQRGLRDNSLD